LARICVGQREAVLITIPTPASSLPKTPSSAEAGLPDQTLRPVSRRNGWRSPSAARRHREQGRRRRQHRRPDGSRPGGCRLLVVTDHKRHKCHALSATSVRIRKRCCPVARLARMVHLVVVRPVSPSEHARRTHCICHREIRDQGFALRGPKQLSRLPLATCEFLRQTDGRSKGSSVASMMGCSVPLIRQQLA
jgi:hypothetical protein